MKWMVDQVNAIVKGGLWNKTVIFISWDDWGGWYDHVTPPNIEQWTDGTQFRYGSRVPCLVLGPYARSGYISKTLHSFVSIVKFCEENFGVQSINQRDGSADNIRMPMRSGNFGFDLDFRNPYTAQRSRQQQKDITRGSSTRGHRCPKRDIVGAAQAHDADRPI
jgi:hypothetical protein